MFSFSARRSLARVLATFLGPEKVSGTCGRVVGRRRLLATGGLAGNGRVCFRLFLNLRGRVEETSH